MTRKQAKALSIEIMGSLEVLADAAFARGDGDLAGLIRLVNAKADELFTEIEILEPTPAHRKHGWLESKADNTNKDEKEKR